MKKEAIMRKTASVALAAAMVAGTAGTAMAASSTDPSNNTATKNDLGNADIIDMAKKGSMTFHKYDTTSAKKDGVAEDLGESTGETNATAEAALADYAVEGVEFTYLNCGKAETYSDTKNGSTSVVLVYEVPDALRQILGLSTKDAYNMTADSVANKCTTAGVYHYNTTQINKALKDLLEGANVSDADGTGQNGASTKNKLAKDALEDYVTSNPAAVRMKLTDKNGITSANNLDLGLYLVVETKVPEEVVETVNPWFVTLPFTKSDGTQWLYDAVCYPKNQTGNPSLDKMVRNATGSSAGTDQKNANTGNYGKQDYSHIVSNLVTANLSADGFAAARGDDQVSAGEYNYEDTTTASEGDVLDYILVSKMPHIQSKATYLTEYTFRDTLAEGITYGKDARIAFYTNEAAAMINDTSKAAEIWGIDAEGNDKDFAQDYVSVRKDYNKDTGETQMTVSFTESGLKKLNEEKSDYWIVIYYTGTVNSDATAVLGDEGNKNDVTLTWRRTSDAYYNTLEDRCYVYTFGIDLTKIFADGEGDPTKVNFVCYNESDGYYLIAREEGTIDGEKVYYVTGKTVNEDEATVFSPDANGKMNIHGVEGDNYQLTETQTDKGYSILKDQIHVDIVTTTRNVDPAVCGYVGNDNSTQHVHTDACYDDGILISSETGIASQGKVLICGQAGVEKANGRTIEKIPMKVDPVVPATASVDNIDAQMTGYTISGDTEIDGALNKDSRKVEAALIKTISSDNGIVNVEVTNNRNTLLPKTGGNGLYAVTIAGIAAVAGGCYYATRKRKHA